MLALALAVLAVFSLGRSLLTMTYMNVKFANEIDPFSRAISHYVFVDRARPMFTATVLTVSAATAAILAGIRWIGIRLGGPTVAFFGMWCVSLVLAGMFPTDDAPTVETVSGLIHQIAGVSLFVSLPLAVSALAHRLAVYPDWTRLAEILRPMALVAGSLALSYLIARLPDLVPGMPIMHFLDARGISGLIQRVLFSLEIVLLMMVAVQLLRVCVSRLDRRRKSGEPSAEGGPR